MEGWVKLYREILEKPIFRNEGRLKVWIWVLCKATHKTTKVQIGKQLQVLHPGQFVTGRRQASEELDMHEMTVWRHLKWLEVNNSLNIKTNNKYSVITVANWGFFQEPDEKVNSKVNSKVNNKNEVFAEVEPVVEKVPPTDEEKAKIYAKRLHAKKCNKLFEEWWKIYPRRDDKVTARTAFGAVFTSGISTKRLNLMTENLMLHTEKYRDEVRGKERRFIKLPSTFLRAVDFREPPS
jgi:hypothetical protein